MTGRSKLILGKEMKNVETSVSDNRNRNNNEVDNRMDNMDKK
jgi:hypothetical protein